MPRFGFPLECVCPALSSAGKNGFRAKSCRKFRNGEEGSNGTEVKTNEGKRERRQHDETSMVKWFWKRLLCRRI